jgi:hypothetical protein
VSRLPVGWLLAALIAVSTALALVATLVHSDVLGWASVAAFGLTLVAYIRWRIARRRPMW